MPKPKVKRYPPHDWRSLRVGQRLRYGSVTQAFIDRARESQEAVKSQDEAVKRFGEIARLKEAVVEAVEALRHHHGIERVWDGDGDYVDCPGCVRRAALVASYDKEKAEGKLK